MEGRQVPLDVILEILVWLPAKTALRFRCVCKEWYNLINSPLFAKLHLNKSLVSDSQHNRILVCNDNLSISIVDDIYDPVKWIKLNWPKGTIIYGDMKHLVGFCNGLILFKVFQMNNGTANHNMVRCFLICNPTTRTFKSILPCSERKWMDSPVLSHGFGYDIEHDDYKIVVTKYVFAEDDRPVCIYSFKTGLWRWTDLPPSVLTGRRWTINGEAIYVSNMLHYLVILNTEYYMKIARFDIVSEKWRDDISLPVQVTGRYVQLGKMDGRLYLHVGEYDIDSSDVWIMEEYGSWKKMFHFSLNLFMNYPIARLKDGCHSLLIRYEYNNKELFWYDQRNNTRIAFKLKRPRRAGLSYMLCIESLVAIPGCSLTKLQQVEDGA